MRWLVAVGDTIVVDQPIAEVETAKSVVEVPSPVRRHRRGAARRRGRAAARRRAVRRGDGGWRGRVTDAVEPAVEAEAYRAEERAGSGNVLDRLRHEGGADTGGRKRRPRRLVARATRRVGTRPPRRATCGGPVAVRSPIVRRLAHDRGVDLHAVTPTGPDGIVTRDDVLRATAPASARAGRDIAARRTSSRTEPLSMLRRTVAAKMTRSRSEIPEATVWVDVDVTELWATRAAMADWTVDARAVVDGDAREVRASPRWSSTPCWRLA